MPRIPQKSREIAMIFGGAFVLCCSCWFFMFLFAFASMIDPKKTADEKDRILIEKLFGGPELIAVILIFLMGFLGIWFITSGVIGLLKHSPAGR